ncbi:hypothetical protein C9374_012353 [Naegleria lovaniensis]|uniref:GST N-terminal domain-containing protein n=1 Tax=Naegleria lovaniensis TaxID=51637 RepID=A0AA88KBR2_NAELO|nr:uncharacterized protein C9374_012353 [Naegleria lovaniensis]KAG2373250.1 hypothetical protein C9374_012353 [Naegleria lovaniensis]
MVNEITYFDTYGRADFIKLIAEIGEIPYTLRKLNFYNEWPLVKPSSRYGFVPFVKINEHWTLDQAIAIARYFAQEGNAQLYPRDRFRATLSEEYIAAMEDVYDEFSRIEFATAEEFKEEERVKFKNGILKRVATALNLELEKHDGYLIPLLLNEKEIHEKKNLELDDEQQLHSQQQQQRLTWADVYLFELGNLLRYFMKVNIEEFIPQFTKLREHVWSNEKALAYLKSERNLRGEL